MGFGHGGVRGGGAVAASGVLEVREARVVRAAAYIQVRVQALQGLTVGEALQAAFRTAKGGTKRHGRANLRWDLQRGYMTVGGKWGREVVCGGEELEFEMSDSEYAYDTGLLFCDRASVEAMAPRVNEHFARWGMPRPESSIVAARCWLIRSASRVSCRYLIQRPR